MKVETQNYFSTGLRLVTQLLKTAAILVGAVTAPTTSRLFAGLFARLVAGPVARLVTRPIPRLGAGSPAISRTRSIATAPRTGAGPAASPATASSTAAAAAVIAVGTVVASVLNAQLATVVLASVQTVDGVLGIVPDAKFKILRTSRIGIISSGSRMGFGSGFNQVSRSGFRKERMTH